MFISDAYLSKHLSMKIFVSSTAKDLEYLRDELYRSLKKLGHTLGSAKKMTFLQIVIQMQTNCLKVAEECDFFCTPIG